jgi:hypothetical protein
MANKHRKRCSPSLMAREMKFKTSRFHSIPIQMVKFKRLAGKNTEELELCAAGQSANYFKDIEKSLPIYYKAKHIFPMKPSMSTPRY